MAREDGAKRFETRALLHHRQSANNWLSPAVSQHTTRDRDSRCRIWDTIINQVGCCFFCYISNSMNLLGADSARNITIYSHKNIETQFRCHTHLNLGNNICRCKWILVELLYCLKSLVRKAYNRLLTYFIPTPFYRSGGWCNSNQLSRKINTRLRVRVPKRTHNPRKRSSCFDEKVVLKTFVTVPEKVEVER